jgi:Leucine-rich repeat (LRR) protein
VAHALDSDDPGFASWLAEQAGRLLLELRDELGFGDPAALRAAAAAPALARLEVLNLAGNGLGDLGAQLLAARPHPAGLRDLDLSHNEIGDEGAAALASAAHLAGLRRLALNGNRITEVGKRVLTSSQHLRKLSALPLHDNWPAALAVFRRSDP